MITIFKTKNLPVIFRVKKAQTIKGRDKLAILL
jgi:hypothetical protein